MQKLVTDRLRAAILAGRFGPGERLSHDDLARWLGVSRMPVREALRVLHAEGLVALRPHRGAVVVDLHPEDIEEIFEIRIMLEAPAARRAALRLTDTHVERIRQFYSDSIAPRVGEETWLDLNRDFHGVIYEACAWPRLINLLDSLRNAVAPYLRAALTLAGRMDTANLEHLQILKACEGRDGDLLAKLTSEHLNSTKAGLVECLSACTLEARSGSGPGPGESRNAREPM